MEVTRRAALLALAAVPARAVPTPGANELRLAIASDPKTFDPLLGGDAPSETIRYLTGGVLIRYNRKTQNLEPELAESWKVSDDGTRVSFQLRQGLRFSDGSPFTAEDVAATIRRMMDPNLHSITGDVFGGLASGLKAQVSSPLKLTVSLAKPVAGLERLFDQMAIARNSGSAKDLAVLGPYRLKEHKPGAYVLLERNPHYWKTDPEGRRLPYIDSVRLDVAENLEIEILKFRRGQLHLVGGLSPEVFSRLQNENPRWVRDIGPSLDPEFLWFNLVPAAPIPPNKRAWFQSSEFRRAISLAINREDLCRVAYQGHARPAVGPFPPENREWFNTALRPPLYDRGQAAAKLEKLGFRRSGQTLRDAQGNAVEFSVLTNAGSKTRLRMAALIQQDLAALGIQLNIVTLDFSSLVERIGSTFAYEACLLGLTNVDPDPNLQMNVWLSSGRTHPWYPAQAKPATAWEAEIDRLMQAQSTTVETKKRKALFDRVQEIVAAESPLIYLVNSNKLIALSPRLENADPVPIPPEVLWNIERMKLRSEMGARPL